MRKDSEHFGDEDLVLIYIAKRLAEAKKLEQVLGEIGIDYLVEPDTYTGGVIFRRARVGAFFYVRGHDVERSHHLMRGRGYRPYETPD